MLTKQVKQLYFIKGGGYLTYIGTRIKLGQLLSVWHKLLRTHTPEVNTSILQKAAASA